MRLMKKILSTLASSDVAAFSAVAASAVQVRDLRCAMGFLPDSDSDKGGQAYTAAVKNRANGELSTKVCVLFLLNFAETSADLRHGIADVGYGM